MGKRAMAVSGEMWQRFCTEGHEIGRGGVATCTSGLLEGAKFVEAVQSERPGHDEPVLLFFYEHPDWEGGDDGEMIPEIAVEYSMKRPMKFSQEEHVLMARALRMAMVQNQYDNGRLSKEDAWELLAGPLGPGDDSTIVDDSCRLTVRPE